MNTAGRLLVFFVTCVVGALPHGILAQTPPKPAGAITFPSQEFGLKVGDTITEIDGQAVTPVEGSTRLYSNSTSIKAITVLRDGGRVTLKRKGNP